MFAIFLYCESVKDLRKISFIFKIIMGSFDVILVNETV